MRHLSFPVFLFFFFIAEMLCCSTLLAKIPTFSPEDFRMYYNNVAKELDAPSMSEKIQETLKIPEKDNPNTILSSVDIYSLNSRTSLLLNTQDDSSKTVLGVAIVSRAGEYTLDESTDIQKAMLALISVMTQDMGSEERQNLQKELGLEEGENGDFTDGKIRSKIVDDILFYTAANENTGLELVIRPVRK